MRKFFRTGKAFFLVGLLCLGAGFLSHSSVVFVSIGVFWLILGIVTRNKQSQKASSEDQTKD